MGTEEILNAMGRPRARVEGAPERAGEDSDAKDRRFVRACLGTWFLGLLFMTAIAVYVNPWGNFGPVGITRWMPSRPAKVEFLRRMPDAQLPKIVVLGSSNSMSLQPATIEAKLGGSAFNFGVFWGKSEDYQTILSWLVVDRRHVPEMLIVGLDAWSLAKSIDDHPTLPGLSRELLNTPALHDHYHARSQLGSMWARLVDSYSIGAFKEYYHLVRSGLRGQDVSRKPAPGMVDSGVFRADGVRVAYADSYGGSSGNIFDMVESGRYPITQLLEERSDGARLGELVHLATYRFEEFSPLRVRALEKFLEIADANRMKVVFVLLPVHPVFARVLERHTRHRENIERLQSLLADLGRTHPSVRLVVDASRIEKFGGVASGFYDEIHPSIGNADLIIGKIADELGR